MRPIWKGQISFGLINIPVDLYSAIKPTELHFKLLDSRNNAKIRYERVNEETGEEVPWNEIVKAYEVKKKVYIPLTEEDFKRAAVENTQSFEIEDFIDRDNIEYTYFQKPYYLVPTKAAKKGYVLLREVLQKKKKIAIGKVVIRSRQYLAALFPQKEVLVLNLIRFADELRNTTDLDIPTGSVKEYKISPKELEMAEKLVESMAVKWQPKKYHDNYQEALMKWVEKKAKLGHIPLPETTEEPSPKSGEVIDFMDLLKKSLKKKSEIKSPKETKQKSKSKKKA